jgi:hypothetical protein
MAEVVNLKGQPVGEHFNVAPDAVLESAKGELAEVVVVGIHNDGTVYLAGSKGSMNTLWLLEAGKWVLMRMDEQRNA